MTDGSAEQTAVPIKAEEASEETSLLRASDPKSEFEELKSGPSGSEAVWLVGTACTARALASAALAFGTLDFSTMYSETDDGQLASEDTHIQSVGTVLRLAATNVGLLGVVVFAYYNKLPTLRRLLSTPSKDLEDGQAEGERDHRWDTVKFFLTHFVALSHYWNPWTDEGHLVPILVRRSSEFFLMQAYGFISGYLGSPQANQVCQCVWCGVCECVCVCARARARV